ncbi:MAG: response regulator [Pseudomonadota bacterium]
MLDGLSVLLAEDNPTNQLVASQMLAALGARAETVGDGHAAIEAAGRQGYDLLLVDIEMPLMAGGDVIRHLRAGHGPNADVPIIALTAYCGDEERASVMAMGADGVIAKPIVSIEGFGAEIRTIMDNRRPRAASAPDGRPWPPRAGDTAPCSNADPDAPGPMSRAPAVRDAPLFDASPIEEFMAISGRERVVALLDHARIDLGEEIGRIIEALAAGDAIATRQAGHRVAGMAGSVGAMRVGEMGRWLDIEPERGIAAAARHARDLAAAWAETDRALAALLAADADADADAGSCDGGRTAAGYDQAKGWDDDDRTRGNAPATHARPPSSRRA